MGRRPAKKLQTFSTNAASFVCLSPTLNNTPKTRRLSAPILALGLLLSTPLPGQPSGPAELTVGECIRRALAHNFDLEIQGFATSIAESGVAVARADFDPTLAVTASKDFTVTAVAGSSLDGSTRPSNQNVATRATVSQRIATGADVSISTRLGRNETNSQFSTLNPAYNSDASLSISQPLLRGAGAAINRAQIRRAGLGLDRAHLDYQARALDIIQSTETAYYNLAFAREQLDVRKSSLALAGRLHDEARTRREVGTATDLDVLQAEVGVANARRGVLLADQTVRDRSDQLLALIGQFELDAPLGATRLGTIDSALPSVVSSLVAAKQHQPDYLALAKTIAQLEIDLRLARDARRLNLAANGALGFNSREGRAGSSYRELFDRDGYNWQLSLTLSYPWGFRAENARLQQNQIALLRERTRLRQLEQNIEVDVRSAVRAVETNFASVDISVLARQLSERQYELEKARFDAGLSTSRRVLEAQTDLETARVNELQSRVSLRASLASLHRIEGSSLQRYGLALP